MRVHAGTSGFSYDEWKGTFYPEDISGNEMLTLTALFLAWFGPSRMPKCDLPL